MSSLLAVCALTLGLMLAGCALDAASAPRRAFAAPAAFDGRVCPPVAAYGQFDRPITVQDI